jgi:hypothetical protein
MDASPLGNSIHKLQVFGNKVVSKIFIPKETEESKRFMVVYVNELLGFAWFPKLLKADPVIVR